MILTTIQVIICRRKLCDVRLWWCYDDHVNELELGQIFGIKYCYILKKFKVFRFDLVLTVKAFPNITSWGFQLSWAKYPAGFFFYLFSFLIITKKKDRVFARNDRQSSFTSSAWFCIGQTNNLHAFSVQWCIPSMSFITFFFIWNHVKNIVNMN